MSDQNQPEAKPGEKIIAVARELGITMTAVFVPWSKSRNAKEKQPSLNWVVSLWHGDREIIKTDYMAGCANAPSYVFRPTQDQHALLMWECENGYKGRYFAGLNTIMRAQGHSLQPKLEDVLYSLASDSDVIDSGTFEEWAANFGYDTDSRKAESIYRACLEIALKLRNAIGEAGLAKLREACQDY